MKERKIIDILEKLGLSKLEITCYLSLLKRSPQRASELSKRFSVPKATILLALQRLADEFGIIKRSKRKNSFLFLVEDIKDLTDFVIRQEEKVVSTKKELIDLLPTLRGMQHYEVAKPKVYYFEGREGIAQALEQVLDEADEYVGYGSVNDDMKYLPKLYPDYYERRVKKGIPVKAIIPALPLEIKEALQNETKLQRKTHLVPKEWYYPIQTNFYKGTVVFHSYEEGFALMIKSKPIADCLLKLFDLAFDKAGEYDAKIRAEAAAK